MTFEEHIEEMPGLAPYGIDVYLRIYQRATEIGAKIAARESVEDLRSRTGTPFVVDGCRRIADALERDPSGRLAAVASLRAWAALPDSIGNTWITWWTALYCAYLDAQKAPSMVPSMVAEVAAIVEV